MPTDEGVIKYTLHHTSGKLETFDLSALCHWHQVAHRIGFVGRDKLRYGGYAYGNVSQRVDESSFTISGTQTGDKLHLNSDECVHVLDFSISKNNLRSHGLIKPSSEAMTHGVIYRSCPEVNFIIHAHVPYIWQQADKLSLPATPADVDYGTPEMAIAVQHLFEQERIQDSGVFVMKGHQDGIFIVGETPQQAGERMLQLNCQA